MLIFPLPIVQFLINFCFVYSLVCFYTRPLGTHSLTNTEGSVDWSMIVTFSLILQWTSIFLVKYLQGLDIVSFFCACTSLQDKPSLSIFFHNLTSSIFYPSLPCVIYVFLIEMAYNDTSLWSTFDKFSQLPQDPALAASILLHSRFNSISRIVLIGYIGGEGLEWKGVNGEDILLLQLYTGIHF